MSLLTDAKNKNNKNYIASEEEIELLIEWLKNNIDYSDISRALIKNNLMKSRNNFYTWITKVTKSAYDKGILNVRNTNQ